MEQTMSIEEQPEEVTLQGEPSSLPEPADKYAHVLHRRREYASYMTISAEIGISPKTASLYAKKLHAMGLLEEDLAYKWHRGNPRKCSRVGRSGKRVADIVSLDEARRLAREVDRGGYEGFNEFLVELFRDWIAEQDAQKQVGK